jgi:hypothetical protein
VPVRTVRRVVVAAAVGAAALAPAGVASAAPRPAPSEPQDQVVLSGRADVPRGRTVGQVIVVHGAAVVDGVAAGDVVVFSGRITIGGQVSGNVVALDGTIVLASTAQVRGDVISRGAVVARKGAQVQGTVRRDAPFTLRGPAEAFGRLATWLAVTVSALTLGLALLWFAPRASDSVLATARRAPWASTGWAAGLSVAVPLLIVALAVSVVGLPLALAALLAIGLVLFVGYAWTAWVVGRLIVRPPRGRLVAFVAGLGILRVAGAVPVVGGVTWVVAGAFGVGAATVAAWSARGAGGKHRAGRAERGDGMAPSQRGSPSPAMREPAPLPVVAERQARAATEDSDGDVAPRSSGADPEPSEFGSDAAPVTSEPGVDPAGSASGLDSRDPDAGTEPPELVSAATRTEPEGDAGNTDGELGGETTAKETQTDATTAVASAARGARPGPDAMPEPGGSEIAPDVPPRVASSLEAEPSDAMGSDRTSGEPNADDDDRPSAAPDDPADLPGEGVDVQLPASPPLEPR